MPEWMSAAGAVLAFGVYVLIGLAAVGLLKQVHEALVGVRGDLLRLRATLRRAPSDEAVARAAERAYLARDEEDV